LPSVGICQHYSLDPRRNLAVLIQTRAHDAKGYGPGRIRSKDKLRGADTGFRRKSLLNLLTQSELQTISVFLAGRQNNNLGEIGVREFRII
jgi:hypothetical protein